MSTSADIAAQMPPQVRSTADGYRLGDPIADQHGTLTSADGTCLFYRYWPAKTWSGQVVIVLHGIGYHSGPYKVIADALNPRGIAVYDDFAHHPTAVDETLLALRARHPNGTLWVVFEPRSATACRALHQDAYARAFGAADRVILAPLGRTNVPESERLDVTRLARDLGPKCEALPGVEPIVQHLAANAKAGDTIAVLSNGAFGGIHSKLIEELGGDHGGGEAGPG